MAGPHRENERKRPNNGCPSLPVTDFSSHGCGAVQKDCILSLLGWRVGDTMAILSMRCTMALVLSPQGCESAWEDFTFHPRRDTMEV
jgi:hypothetical protein